MTEIQPHPNLLTRAEAATLFRVSRRTISHHIKRGLPSVRIGKRRFIKRDEATAWIFASGADPDRKNLWSLRKGSKR